MTDREPHRQTGTPVTRSKAPHIYEVDMVRILTFGCVIGVHVVSHTSNDEDLGLNVLLGMLHFTRQTFFALSAFVLLYSYRYHPRPMRQFWPRRFLLVGVPYVSWSILYFSYDYLRAPTDESMSELILRFLIALLTGTAWTHMYFLLVTMQLYLLFPVLVWLVNITRGHHLALLITTALVQLALTTVYMYRPTLLGVMRSTGDALFINYVFTFTLGALASEHRQTVFSWVRTHHRTIVGIDIAGAVLLWSAFAFNHLALGRNLYRMGVPIQPAMVLWSVPVDLTILTFGTIWADRRRKNSPADVMLRHTTDWSFGIFLIHPLLITTLLAAGDTWLSDHIDHPWLSLVLYLLVVGLSCLLVALIRHTPLSLALTGRKVIWPRWLLRLQEHRDDRAVDAT